MQFDNTFQLHKKLKITTMMNVLLRLVTTNKQENLERVTKKLAA